MCMMYATSNGQHNIMEDFNRQRRSLNIVSIALIVYFGAGGNIPDEMVITTFGITLANKPMAITFIGIAFAYFWYRFRLFGMEAKKVWHVQRHFELDKEPKFRSMIESLEYPDSEFRHTSERTPVLIRNVFSRNVVKVPQLVRKNALNSWIEHYGKITSTKDVNPKFIARLPLRHYFIPATKAYFRAARRFSGWSDYALPKLLAWLAVGSALFALIKHGIAQN